MGDAQLHDGTVQDGYSTAANGALRQGPPCLRSLPSRSWTSIAGGCPHNLAGSRAGVGRGRGPCAGWGPDRQRVTVRRVAGSLASRCRAGRPRILLLRRRGPVREAPAGGGCAGAGDGAAGGAGRSRGAVARGACRDRCRGGPAGGCGGARRGQFIGAERCGRCRRRR